MFVLSDIVAEGKHAAIAIRSNVHQIQHALICDVLGQTLKVTLRKVITGKCTVCIKTILYVFMFLGAKVEPVLVEDINFYKAKFGKEPPCKKVKPSPAVTEKHGFPYENSAYFKSIFFLFYILFYTYLKTTLSLFLIVNLSYFNTILPLF